MWFTEKLYRYFALCMLLVVSNAYLIGQCSPPTLVQVSESGPDSIAISWIYFGDADGWEMELVPSGASPTLTPTTPIVSEQAYVFDDLLPATAYTIFIRTVCDGGTISEWNPISVRTQIPQPSPCLFALPIKNNNCNQGLEAFDIEVNGMNGNLGEDLFLSSVDLIIEHTWPADLDIRLTSPTGVEVSLSKNNGTVTDNYGDISSTDCEAVTSFSDLACTPISDDRPPYIGSFLPESPLFAFEDGSTADGVWQLNVCDRSSQDIGRLKYVNLNFEPLLCEIPRDILVKSIGATSVEVTWQSFEGCTATVIELGLTGDTPGAIRTTSVECSKQEVVINDLLPGTTYDIYVLSTCLAVESPLSCPFTFTTACQTVTMSESFDDKEICTPGCAFACDTGGSWFNISESDDQDWLLWHLETNTEDTGPQKAVFGGGNYIYIESSPDVCMPDATAILESSCMEVITSDSSCDFSFWYHMFGSDIGTLSLLIQVNESEEWDTLHTISGDQGDTWTNVVVSLQPYDGAAAIFRFVAETMAGTKGDIALDQIEFRGSIARPEGFLYFQDLDQDGFGNSEFPVNLCTTDPSLVFVTNDEDCNDSNEFINPDAMEIPCNDIDENCNGDQDNTPAGQALDFVFMVSDDNCSMKGSGSISLEVISGQEPFTFLWSNNATSQDVSDLISGFYRVTITDSNMCSVVSEDIFVDEISNIGVSVIDILRPSCFGQLDGEITVQGENGTAPYDFIWSSGGIEANSTELAAGMYDVLAIDASGCISDTLTIDLLAEGAIEGDVSFKIDVRCAGGNSGRVAVDAISGTPPYSYKWEMSDTTKQVNNLAAGSYTCTITDAIGCEAIVVATISEPDELQSEVVSQENISCFGETTGSIRTTIFGGVGPYTFAWDSGQVTDDIFDLSAGTYTLTVTDANACSAISRVVVLTQPEVLSVEMDSTVFARCILSEDGYLSVEVDGGVGDYNYFWSSTDLDSAVLQDITPGIYSVTVTDQNNCKATLSNFELEADSEPIIVDLESYFQNLCFNDKHVELVANLSQARPPIIYNWSAGVSNESHALSDTISNLDKGTYRLTVTDVEGCIGLSDTILVSAGDAISLEVTEKVDNECYDASDGSITVAAMGGLPPFKYLWDTGDTTSIIESLTTSKYRVTVTDANDCSFISQNISINSLPAFEVVVETSPQTAVEGNGSIALSISGASPPYGIKWPDDVANDDELLATDLLAGVYNIIISDIMDCDTTLIVEVELVDATEDVNDIHYVVSPNPTKSEVLVTSNEMIQQVKIYDLDGRLYSQNSVEANTVILRLGHLEVGIYILEIQTDKGHRLEKIVKF